MSDETSDDENIGPEEMEAYMKQAFLAPTVAETHIVAVPDVGAPDAGAPAEKKAPTETIMIVPDAAGLAKMDTVTRCDACGYDVVPDDGHICERGGGRLVECHPFGCAVKGCLAQRRGTKLPSLGHHAAHMQWHLDKWEKAAAAPAAVAALPPPPRTIDRWASGSFEVPPGGDVSATLNPPAENAVCVALLFQSQYMACLVGACWKVGQAPLSAYITEQTPLLAVVPVDGTEPGQGGEVAVANDSGGVAALVRIGARWEIPPGG